jgi:hypothetical protein
MPRLVLMEQFHLNVYVPSTLAPHAERAVRRALDDRRLHARIRRAVRGVFATDPALARVRLTLTR